MADQSSNRTLPATPKKLGKAREQGQIVRSKEFGHLVTIGMAGTLLVTMGPAMTDWMQQTVVQGLRFDREMMQNTGMMNERLAEMTVRMLWIVIPFCCVMAATGIAASVAIGGWNFTLTPLIPNFARFNPITGLIGLMSKAKLIDAMKGSLLAVILGTIGGAYLKSHFAEFASVLGMPLPAALQQASSSTLGGLWLLLMAVCLFALIDVPLQRYNFAQQMKMSHSDVKQEQKEANGSPEVKNKIRAKMREATKRRMMAAVPSADLVVMNPTHYAVALKYDDARMGAPRVVAKGADLLAMAIRDLAKDNKVPVLQAPALARALFAHTELDHEIPAALFAAVAQVLAYVYQLRAAISGRAAMPMAFPELNVPPELDPHNKPA
jgi:flagellar biosynthetic protein FlhB